MNILSVINNVRRGSACFVVINLLRQGIREGRVSKCAEYVQRASLACLGLGLVGSLTRTLRLASTDLERSGVEGHHGGMTVRWQPWGWRPGHTILASVLGRVWRVGNIEWWLPRGLRLHGEPSTGL